MRTLARLVLPLIASILVFGIGCSSEGTTPSCPDDPKAVPCMEPPSGGGYVVGQGGSTGGEDAATGDDAEPEVDAEAAD